MPAPLLNCGTPCGQSDHRHSRSAVSLLIRRWTIGSDQLHVSAALTCPLHASLHCSIWTEHAATSSTRKYPASHDGRYGVRPFHDYANAFVGILWCRAVMHVVVIGRTDWLTDQYTKQAVGGRPPRYAAALLLPRGRRSALRRRADGNVTAVSHGQHVATPTIAAAWRANTAVSKAAWWPWPLTFWPWKWCSSHVCRGLPLCQFWSSWASLFST